MIDIILIAVVLFVVFITPSIIRRWYFKKKYIKLINKYKNDYKNNKEKSLSYENVYNINDYREIKLSERPDDIVKHSRTHILVWSEEIQDYVKTPRTVILDDEDIN